MKSFLSIKETAEYLNLEYKTVYRLVRAGDIPAARFGSVYRIQINDLEHYIKQQKLCVLATLEEPKTVVDGGATPGKDSREADLSNTKDVP